MDDFHPNTVTIPWTWVEYLEQQPAKAPAFIQRVKGVMVRQRAAFTVEGQRDGAPALTLRDDAASPVDHGTPLVEPLTPAPPPDDLPLDKPAENSPAVFHRLLTLRLADDCPQAAPPTAEQSQALLDLTAPSGDPQGVIVANLVTHARKVAINVAAKSGTAPTRHISSLLNFFRNKGDAEAAYAELCREVAAFLAAAPTPQQAEATRQAANQRLERNPPPLPVESQDIKAALEQARAKLVRR